MALTKSDIIEKISLETALTNKQSGKSVEKIIEILKSTLESGDDILISGFGKMSVQDKNERKGRNPATGDDMMLPARKVVSFKSSGKLREQINGGEGV